MTYIHGQTYIHASAYDMVGFILTNAYTELQILKFWNSEMTNSCTELRFLLGASYITGQWGEFRVKNATLYLQIYIYTYIYIYIAVFHQKICVLSFSFLSLTKYQISATEY